MPKQNFSQTENDIHVNSGNFMGCNHDLYIQEM